MLGRSSVLTKIQSVSNKKKGKKITYLHIILFKHLLYINQRNDVSVVCSNYKKKTDMKV